MFKKAIWLHPPPPSTIRPEKIIPFNGNSCNYSYAGYLSKKYFPVSLDGNKNVFISSFHKRVKYSSEKHNCKNFAFCSVDLMPMKPADLLLFYFPHQWNWWNYLISRICRICRNLICRIMPQFRQILISHVLHTPIFSITFGKYQLLLRSWS